MKIKIVDYTKIIKKNTILNNINFTFESGKIYGLHGRNGSGKTMLMRAIAGLILPTQGYVIIDDKVIGKDMDFPESCGVLIENMNLIQENSGLDNLKMIAKIKNKITVDEMKNVMCDLGLDPNNKKSIRTYSLGMKQKLNIAQAIMEKPKLLLLDEPTNALDEKSVSKVKDILIEAKNQGTLIIIASHNKDDLLFLSDEIIEIEDGKIVN